MTALNPPLAITLDSAGVAAQHPAASFRRLVELLAAGQTGARTASDLAVTANGTPNMTTIVAAGEALVPGTEVPATQGAYYVYNDGAVTLTHAAANGTNPRRDLVVARVYDREYSGTTGAWALEIVAGTPAASPTDPATPANSVVLARVTVRAATASILTSDITDLRPRLALGGGTLTATAATRPAAPANGQAIYETDTGRLLIWDGAEWAYIGTTANTGGGTSAAGSAPLTLTTTSQDVVGATVTFTAPSAGRYLIPAVFDIDVTAAGGGLVVGTTMVDGAAQSSLALSSVGARSTVSSLNQVDLAAGSHTIKLMANKSVAAGTVTVQAVHTRLAVIRAT